MSWNITFPDGIVRDSLKAKIILNADLMGPTLHVSELSEVVRRYINLLL